METLAASRTIELSEDFYSWLVDQGFNSSESTGDLTELRMEKELEGVRHELRSSVKNDKLHVTFKLFSEEKQKIIEYRWVFTSSSKLNNVKYVISKAHPVVIRFPLSSDEMKLRLSSVIQPELLSLAANYKAQSRFEQTEVSRHEYLTSLVNPCLHYSMNYVTLVEFIEGFSANKMSPEIDSELRAMISESSVERSTTNRFEYEFEPKLLNALITTGISRVFEESGNSIHLSINSWTDVKNYA